MRGHKNVQNVQRGVVYIENEFKNRGKSYLLRGLSLFQAFWLSVFSLLLT